jgi:hypothetical protein
MGLTGAPWKKGRIITGLFASVMASLSSTSLLKPSSLIPPQRIPFPKVGGYHDVIPGIHFVTGFSFCHSFLDTLYGTELTRV